MSIAAMVQRLIATADAVVPILEAAESAGAVFLAEECGAGRILLGLMKDGSLFLSVIQDDPEDPDRDQWSTASFPDLTCFGSFLHDALDSDSQRLLPLLPPELRQYLTSAVDKFILARSLEAGHA